MRGKNLHRLPLPLPLSRAAELRSALWSLDVFSSVFQSPEGRRENSPGLQAWESLKKIALKGRPTSGRYSQKLTFVKSDSMAFQKQKSAGTITWKRD